MSTGLLIFLCILLIGIIIVQIGKMTELAAGIRDKDEIEEINSKRQASLFILFMVGFLIFCIASAMYYKNWMLGYGPHQSASAQGGDLDYLFNITLFFTGIVFFITQITLFYFAYKYRSRKGQKASFMPHDNKLEVIWTAIPALVMTFLVVGGLDVWNEVMADVPEEAVLGQDYIEIEATGQQFLWHIRYPGTDHKLGARNFRLIKGGVNPIGQDWIDDKNLDDFFATDIVLPVGKTVRVRITALDVLHNFDLPHFRVKMDAVPGMPTYFVFTPIKTTEEYRQELRKYPEYQAPSDPADPNSDPLWKTFEYELACAELCGTGHYSMKKIVKIVSEDEYEDWYRQQPSFYMNNVRGTDDDPNKDRLLSIEIQQRKQEFDTAVDKALAETSDSLKIIRLNYVTFETGSATLTPLSRYELDNLVAAMNKYGNMTVQLAGHTDNTGDSASNKTLSENRAISVFNYLRRKGIAAERMTPKGYGDTSPIDTNATEEGRQQNRRTEFKILTQ